MNEEASPSVVAIQSTQNIVTWPCDRLPYAQTVRARFFARIPERYRSSTAYIVFALLVGALATPHHIATLPGVATPLLAWALFATVAWSVGVLFRHRVMKTVWSALANDPDGSTSQWRATWSRLESASTALKEAVRDSSRPLTPDTAWDAAPRFPPVAWRLFDVSTCKNGQFSLAASTAFAAVAVGTPSPVEVVRGRILLALASVGGRSVVGRAGDTIIATFMASEGVSTQYWVIVQVTPTGSALSISVQSGLMWWVEAGTQINDGSKAVGDVLLYRLPVMLRHLRKSPVATMVGLCFVAMCMTLGWYLAVPAVLLAYVALVYDAWRRPVDELAARTNSHPSTGDSLDLALLGCDRERGELEPVRPTNQVLDQVHALSQEVMTKLHAAASATQSRTHALREED